MASVGVGVASLANLWDSFATKSTDTASFWMKESTSKWNSQSIMTPWLADVLKALIRGGLNLTSPKLPPIFFEYQRQYSLKRTQSCTSKTASVSTATLL